MDLGRIPHEIISILVAISPNTAVVCEVAVDFNAPLILVLFVFVVFWETGIFARSLYGKRLQLTLSDAAVIVFLTLYMLRTHYRVANQAEHRLMRRSILITLFEDGTRFYHTVITIY